MQTLKFLKELRELLALSSTTLPALQNTSRNAATSGQNQAQNSTKKLPNHTLSSQLRETLW